MSKKRNVVVFLLLTLAVGLSHQKTVDSAERTKVRVPSLEGTQSFPLTVLQEKIGPKYDLDVVLEKAAGPIGVYTKIKTGDYHITTGAWLTLSIFRAQGHKLKQIYSMNDMSANFPVVAKDSPIRDYGALKGKRIGLFAGPTATTTFMLRTLSQKYYGFDPLKEAKLQFGAPPLLWGMLGKGELDAVVTLEPFVTKMLETGNFRTLPSLGKSWHDRTGQRILLVTLVANEDWLEANEDAAKRFVKAFKESVDFVRGHPEVWTEIAKKLGVKSEESRKALYDRAAPAFITRWDRLFVEEQVKWADSVRETFGGKIKGIPDQIPDDGWSFKYAP